MSREVWAPDKYPLWFQGLVYFLTPQHTGELFNTALNTHYMHTDDVFLGIVVNKTKVFTSSTLYTLNWISQAEVCLWYLKTLWDSGNAIFFHVPNIKLYESWYAEETKIPDEPVKPSSNLKDYLLVFALACVAVSALRYIISCRKPWSPLTSLLISRKLLQQEYSLA